LEKRYDQIVNKKEKKKTDAGEAVIAWAANLPGATLGEDEKRSLLFRAILSEGGTAPSDVPHPPIEKKEKVSRSFLGRRLNTSAERPSDCEKDCPPLRPA